MEMKILFRLIRKNCLLFVLFVSGIFLSIQCKDDVSPNFIQYYYSIDSMYCDGVNEYDGIISFNFGLISSNASKTQIDSMRSLYKDNHYNEVIDEDNIGGEVLINHLDSIHVVSDADFNKTHPAGALLDDLFDVGIYGYYGYLTSNYGRDGDCQWQFSKKISEFEYKDGHLINSFGLSIPNNVNPIEKEHNLTITYYFTNLKPQVLKYKVVFE